ncbi:MAG TPA: hypothetical protein VHS05_14505 [Pyrinomonadaceae bacterium]|jgi:hypothetical protein|nr:hypothetical protein [Pyrinomonadaceae bacterium]
MNFLFLLSLLTTLWIPPQPQDQTNDGSPLTVTSFKWTRARRVPPTPEVEGNAPARAVIPQNKIFARNARANESPGGRDPNADTLDGRSAALEKSVAESRAPQAEPVDGFAYRIKVQNPTTKVIEALFWEYRFEDPATPDQVSRRQFLCGVDIRGGKSKDLEGFSRLGPSDVVNVKSLNSGTTFKESILINRIEYSDGSLWQRKTWNLAEVKGSYERVLREPWLPGMCKGL